MWNRKRSIGATLRILKLASAFLRGREYARQEPNARSGPSSFVIAQQIITSANVAWWSPYTKDFRPVMLKAIEAWLEGGVVMPLGEALAGCQ